MYWLLGNILGDSNKIRTLALQAGIDKYYYHSIQKYGSHFTAE
jgi:hypothetical protein